MLSFGGQIDKFLNIILQLIPDRISIYECLTTFDVIRKNRYVMNEPQLLLV